MSKEDIISVRIGWEELKKLEKLSKLGKGERSLFLRNAIKEKFDRDWEVIKERLQAYGLVEKDCPR